MNAFVFEDCRLWLESEKKTALATVTQTWGSSPRPVGSLLAVNQEGGISGSVSGGCVEGAVIDAAQEVIRGGSPARLHFGVSDDQAWEVGLACGGEIEVFVRPFRQENLAIWSRALAGKKPFIHLLVIEGEGAGGELIRLEDGSLLSAGLDADQGSSLVKLIDQDPRFGKKSSGVDTLPQGGIVFWQSVLPALRLIIIGGGHIAIPLVKMAQILGFETAVVDPRRIFASSERFPEADQLIQEWPQPALQQVGITASSAIVTLTHDPKIDDPALLAALRSPAFYIGALGSQKTHQNRLERLRGEGMGEDELRRIHAPVGLDLGGRTPEEIALAILAEIVQAWNVIAQEISAFRKA